MHLGGCKEPLSSFLSPEPAGCPSPEGTNTVNKQTPGRSERAPRSAHVVVRPQLQAAGADPEHAGEELIRVEEVRDVKVLGQVRKLFVQISRFLSRRENFFFFKSLVSWGKISHALIYAFIFLGLKNLSNIFLFCFKCSQTQEH